MTECEAEIMRLGGADLARDLTEAQDEGLDDHWVTTKSLVRAICRRIASGGYSDYLKPRLGREPATGEVLSAVKLSELAWTIACEIDGASIDTFVDGTARPEDQPKRNLGALYAKDNGYLTGFVVKRLGKRPAVAAEIVADSWGDFIIRFLAPRGSEPFLALQRIRTRLCEFAKWRVVKHRQGCSDTEPDPGTGPLNPAAPGGDAELRERFRKALEECIAALPPKQSQIAHMYWIRGLLQWVIAESLGITRPAVRQSLDDSFPKIAVCLKPKGFGDGSLKDPTKK